MNLVQRMATHVLYPAITVAVGCGGSAPTPQAQPHDASVAHHEAMAARDDREAVAHDAKHDATPSKERCHYAHTTGASDPFCWTTVSNPTAEHGREAERHSKMAADHRAASQALRDAEAKACVGLADEDRDTSPFYHRQDIIRVDTLPAQTPGGRPDVGVVFRALPGMTAVDLQRLVDCHLARASSLGHQVPEMDYCPLMPKGVTAKVSSSEGALVVVIHANDPVNADEVARRAKALAPQ